MESFNDARDNIDGLLGHFNELYESFGKVVGIPRRAHRIYDNVKQLLNGTH